MRAIEGSKGPETVTQAIAKTFVVRAAPDAVWSFLTDLRRVASFLPRAILEEELNERTYTGSMTIKVGPVLTYRGKVVVERLDPTDHTAEILATGQDVGGKGGLDLRLTCGLKALPGGRTQVSAVCLLKATGLLAQLGRRRLQDVGDELFQTFSEQVRARLEARENSTTGPAENPAKPGAWWPRVWALAVLALVIALYVFLNRLRS